MSSTLQKQTNAHDQHLNFFDKISKDIKHSIRKTTEKKAAELSNTETRKEIRHAKIKRDISVDSIVYNKY